MALRQLRSGSWTLALGFVASLWPVSGQAVEPEPGSGAEGQRCALLGESGESLRSFVTSRVDCAFALPESDVQLRLSYSRQAWHASPQSRSTPARATSSDGQLRVGAMNATGLLDRPWTAYAPSGGLEEGLGSWILGGETTLGLKGQRGRLAYWADYQLFREGRWNPWAAEPRDHSSRRVGAEFSWGVWKPSVEFAQVRKPTDKNPGETELATTGKLSLALSLPKLPLLTLTYAREERKTASTYLDRTSSGPESEGISGTLWYGRAGWDAYLTSSYSWTRETERSGSNARTYDHILGGSYQLTDALMISPMLELMRFVDPSSGYWMDMRATYLGAYYANGKLPLDVSLYGSYVQSQDSTGSMDSRSLNLSLTVERELAFVLDGLRHRPKAGLKVVHSRYRDLAYDDSDSRVTSVFLTFEIRR